MTAASCLAPVGLGPVQMGNEGGTQPYICRGCPFFSLSRHLAAGKASCLSAASVASPAQKLQTPTFFSTHFEGACTSHMRALGCIHQLNWTELQHFTGTVWHLSSSSVLALSFVSDFYKKY